MDSIIQKISEAFLKILSAPVKGLLKPCFGSSQLESIIKFLKFAGTGQSRDFDASQYFDMMNTIFDLLKPVGFALITTFFIIHMIDAVSKDTITLDNFVKSLIGLVIVISLAANSGQIMTAIFNIGESSIDSVYSGITQPDGSSDKSIVDQHIDEAAETLTINYGAAAIFLALILWLMHQIVIIGIDVAAFSRIIDIGWRAACMPIGLSNSFEGGVNSSGIRYLKGFIAAVFSGALMLIICAIGFSLATSLLNTQLGLVDFVTGGNFWTVMIETAAVQLATMGAAIAAPAKAKELFS